MHYEGLNAKGFYLLLYSIALRALLFAPHDLLYDLLGFQALVCNSISTDQSNTSVKSSWDKEKLQLRWIELKMILPQ